METRQQNDDEICNRNWDGLLKVFHKIAESSKDKKQQYESLKEVAKTKQLSPRQSEGISARCDYQISLIDNPDQKHFSNMHRKDDRHIQLDKTQSNGKH
jgi:hypothetical protein